ncbi:hypothetical protein DL770_009822 [Monosporascus sp. CRB-9-2]|nr:hypothetical protein DL770_009822 [Monosporascus sp. CRB-9-2]
MASRTLSSFTSPNRKDAEIGRRSRLSTESAPAPQLSEAQVEQGYRSRPPTQEKAGSRGDASVDEATGRNITGARWFLVCAALYLADLLYGLDTTIAADIQGAVIDAFSDVSQLAWIGAGFLLGSVAVILPYGFLFTSFDMKWLYVAGVALFQIGSAVCAAAPSMNALIMGRVIAGAGGTGIYLGGLNYFSELTTWEERGTYLSGTGFVWGVGAILGPLVGGGFAVSPATWRWGFWINLVIGAVTAPIMLLYPPSIYPSEGKLVGNRLANLDFVGFVLSVGVWVAFAMGLISAGGVWPWNDGRTIATLVVFGVLPVLYVLQQYFCVFTTPSNRSFPGHLLKSRTQVLLYVATSCAITALFITTYYIPIYFQFVQNDTTLMAALRLLPFLLVTVSVNLASEWALSRIKYYMPFFLASGILLTVAGSLFYVYLKPSTPAADIDGFSVVMAVGTGLTLQLGYTVATLKAEPADAVSAINLQNVSQIGSTVICLVVGGQIFQNAAVGNLRQVLAGRGLSEAELRDAVSWVHSAVFETLSGDIRDSAVAAISAAMQKSFVLVIVAGALEILSALGMKFERLFGEIVTIWYLLEGIDHGTKKFGLLGGV